LRSAIPQLPVVHRTDISGIQITKEGILNIVRQATTAGVKRVSFVGTVDAALDLSNRVVKAPLSDQDWNSMSADDAAKSSNPAFVYAVAKTQAELALWKFTEQHPELNLITGTS
jgi:nucleoside-diphosphate-sugar epimerase